MKNLLLVLGLTQVLLLGSLVASKNEVPRLTDAQKNFYLSYHKNFRSHEGDAAQALAALEQRVAEGKLQYAFSDFKQFIVPVVFCSSQEDAFEKALNQESLKLDVKPEYLAFFSHQEREGKEPVLYIEQFGFEEKIYEAWESFPPRGEAFIINRVFDFCKMLGYKNLKYPEKTIIILSAPKGSVQNTRFEQIIKFSSGKKMEESELELYCGDVKNNVGYSFRTSSLFDLGMFQHLGLHLEDK